ncbi:MAG: hypothetical protein OHK0024_24080 [Thalassobaculales bacterium]
MTAVLAHALAFARRGLLVLPLHAPVAGAGGRPACSCGRRHCTSPAKHPRTPRGVHDATREAALLRAWFGAAVPVNLGIATGAGSGIVVLDIDPRHGGDDSLAELERRHGALPVTWRFLTGGGGEHVVFRHPGRPVPNSAGALGPGLDVRGDGGYIVAPPSTHISGRAYAISVDHHPADVGLAELPAWLLDRLAGQANAVRRPAPPAAWRAGVVAGLDGEGRRNETVARLAGYLFGCDVDARLVLALAQSWNRTHCRPPLDDAEVVRTVDSIAKRELAKRRGDGQAA